MRESIVVMKTYISACVRAIKIIYFWIFLTVSSDFKELSTTEQEFETHTRKQENKSHHLRTTRSKTYIQKGTKYFNYFQEKYTLINLCLVQIKDVVNKNMVFFDELVSYAGTLSFCLNECKGNKVISNSF